MYQNKYFLDGKWHTYIVIYYYLDENTFVNFLFFSTIYPKQHLIQWKKGKENLQSLLIKRKRKPIKKIHICCVNNNVTIVLSHAAVQHNQYTSINNNHNRHTMYLYFNTTIFFHPVLPFIDYIIQIRKKK